MSGRVTGRGSWAQDSSPSTGIDCWRAGRGGEGEARAGGNWVRPLCLCKSVAVSMALCVFLCNYQAQLSSALLWPASVFSSVQ